MSDNMKAQHLPRKAYAVHSLVVRVPSQSGRFAGVSGSHLHVPFAERGPRLRFIAAPFVLPQGKDLYRRIFRSTASSVLRPESEAKLPGQFRNKLVRTRERGDALSSLPAAPYFQFLDTGCAIPAIPLANAVCARHTKVTPPAKDNPSTSADSVIGIQL
jgi:hypothetical protein